MKNKNIIIIVIVGSLLLGTSGSIVTASSGLQVTFTTNPVTAAPGTNGYLEVTLKSVGTTVNDIEITATSWDTSVVTRQGNWDVKLASLESGETYSLLYEFTIAATASPGLYQVIFQIESSGSNAIRQTALIKVDDPTVLDLTSVSPTSITIGEATTLSFQLENNGAATLENILFTWEDPNTLILPVGSDNRIRISSVPGHNSTNVPVVVMASSGLSPGVYPLDITLDFYDQGGTQQIITSIIGIQISGTTTFDVVVQQSTTASTTFAVVNTGANTASSVVVSIPQQPLYTTTGTSSSSLGNLEAGDYTLASFSITSTSTNTSNPFSSFNRTSMNIPSERNFTGNPPMMFENRNFTGMSGTSLRVQISYTDVFGVRQTSTKQVNLTSASSTGFSSRTSTQNSGQYPSDFMGRSQTSGLTSNGLAYIIIGVVGIIVIVAIIQLGRKKKLPHLAKYFKGRKE